MSCFTHSPDATTFATEMTFAFDLDGTLNRYPHTLGAIMTALSTSGHRVIVLTAVGPGETSEHRKHMLASVGITGGFSQLVLVPDNMGVAKASYCRDNLVDVLIDDAPHNLAETARLSPRTARLHLLP